MNNQDFDDQLSVVLLIESILNETAQEDEIQRLAQIIANDADARQLYLDYCELHSALMFRVQSAQATELAFEALANRSEAGGYESTTDGRGLKITEGSSMSPYTSYFLTPVPLTAMITTVLVASIFSVLLYVVDVFHPSEIAGVAPADRESVAPSGGAMDQNTTAAMITGLVDCVWKNSAARPKMAAPLKNGSTLSLESGLVQVTFESGAKMIVEGPAEFTLVSSMEARFSSGRMTSFCPPSAHGFTVHSPEATVVDLGTEFGVNIVEGKTEVHVFSGEVVGWNNRSINAGKVEKVHLRQDNSVTFESDRTLKIVEVDIEKFVRNIDDRLDEDELPPLPVKRELVLWLAADKLVKTDDGDGVLVWQDLVAGDNQHFDNAWQFVKLWRPKLVEDGMGGMPVVRFDGRSSFLMTTPLATSNDQTVFIVFSMGERSSQRLAGGQLLNYNGPPHRYLTKPGSPGVLQIGDLASTRVEYQKPGFLRGHVFAGFRDKLPVDAGETYSRSVLPENVGTVCAYRYSYESGKSDLFINGDRQASASAPTPIEVVSRKVIGRHGAQNFFFYGDMAELLIFNDALDADEMEAINQYLHDRYSLDFD